MNAVDIVRLIHNEIAPFDWAMDSDPVGFWGNQLAPIDNVVLGLDFTYDVLSVGEQLQNVLYVIHHPSYYTAELSKKELSSVNYVIAHTNFDFSFEGIASTMAQGIGLTNIEPILDGMMYVGEYNDTLKSLLDTANETFNTTCRVYGANWHKPIHKVAVSGGAGAFLAREAAKVADCYITGEVSYSQGLSAFTSGSPLIEAGHYETESYAFQAMARQLKALAPDLEVTYVNVPHCMSVY